MHAEYPEHDHCDPKVRHRPKDHGDCDVRHIEFLSMMISAHETNQQSNYRSYHSGSADEKHCPGETAHHDLIHRPLVFVGNSEVWRQLEDALKIFHELDRDGLIQPKLLRQLLSFQKSQSGARG